MSRCAKAQNPSITLITTGFVCQEYSCIYSLRRPLWEAPRPAAMRAFSRSSSKPTVRSSAGYAALFDKYKESGSETIGPDGVERL